MLPKEPSSFMRTDRRNRYNVRLSQYGKGTWKVKVLNVHEQAIKTYEYSSSRIQFHACLTSALWGGAWHAAAVPSIPNNWLLSVPLPLKASTFWRWEKSLAPTRITDISSSLLCSHYIDYICPATLQRILIVYIMLQSTPFSIAS